MTPKTITKSQFVANLKLVTSSGEVSSRTVAALLRTALARWGLCPKRQVLQYARDQLRTGAVTDVDCVPNVLDHMISLGECDVAYIASEVYLAPLAARWIAVGGNIAAHLGVSGPPNGVKCVPTDNHLDIVQRIRVESDEDETLLSVGGSREEAMSDWILPVGYLVHASRRLRRPARSDKVNLAEFWNILEAALGREGLPLGDDAEVRAVTGEPGQFFGRYNSTTPEGRWTATPPDGVWCAYRRGYGESHWHPALVAVNEGTRRTLDLHDVDEWQWALLARGRRLGLDETIRAEGQRIQLSFPPPLQLRTALDLLGSPVAAWTWEVNPGAPDLLELLQ